MQLTISSCYSSVTLILVLIVRDGGLSTPCHSCRFDYQQRVLKTFSGPDYLYPEDEVVRLLHILVNIIDQIRADLASKMFFLSIFKQAYLHLYNFQRFCIRIYLFFTLLFMVLKILMIQLLQHPKEQDSRLFVFFVYLLYLFRMYLLSLLISDPIQGACANV